MKTGSGYFSSDAWLLAAISTAHRSGLDPTLARVIRAGDFLNRAIFTLSELNGGLDRLLKGGFISIQGQQYRLTESGKEMAAIDPAAKKGVMHYMDTVRERLGAPGWHVRTMPDEAGDLEAPRMHVTEGMFEEALAEYRESGKRTGNKDNHQRG